MLGPSVAAWTESLRRRAVPNHFSSLFGVIAVANLLLLIVTGMLLVLVYEPSGALIRYQGSYAPLKGVVLSEAYASTLHISLDLRGGLLVRQAHHWAALILPAALLLQLASLFFTGGFRHPRRWAWLLLVGVFVLTLVSGWSGYALPDDSLSGTGLRIVEGVTLGVPLIGTPLSVLLFGGDFPGEIIEHLYLVHLVVPALLVVLTILRARLGWRTAAAELRRPGRLGGRVVDMALWPTAMVSAAGLSCITIGVVVLMAGAITIAPVWMYGPSSPGNAFAGSQPDWYTGFLDGALRLVPSGWEFQWWGRTWTPAVLVPLGGIGLFFALLALYPFLESWRRKDHREHDLLDRPRDAPAQTGVGVAGLVFYGALWAAGSADLVSTQFRVSFEGVIRTLRVIIVLGPVAAYVVARQACLTLQASDRDRLRVGAESGRIERSPLGGYTETHPTPKGGVP